MIFNPLKLLLLKKSLSVCLELQVLQQLQLILARLEAMQGRLQVLQTKSAEAASQEAYGESASRDEPVSRSVFATTEEDDHGAGNDESEQRTHHKQARSQSPHSDHRFFTKDEEVDEDPSYRQFLASIRGFLDLSTPEEYKKVPSKIFGSKDRKKKQAVLPMCLPPVEEINAIWTELEKKVAENPSENGERLHFTLHTSLHLSTLILFCLILDLI